MRSSEILLNKLMLCIIPATLRLCQHSEVWLSETIQYVVWRTYVL